MSSVESPLTLDQSEDPETRVARFVIGIDLGTTNSAMCSVDTQQAEWKISTFPVPQVVAVGEVEALETLPSFHYQLLPDEQNGRTFQLPWQRAASSPAVTGDSSYVVGTFARDHGRAVPGRMIESAKSWLCHHGVDRRASLLPWHAASDVPRLSPVEASARYLRHLHDAWNAAHPDAHMHQQDVVLTIPASFDEVARELTVAAARLAGLPKIVLIEEPQAAFYSWVYAHRSNWEQLVHAGQKILVCDIGGGTTDFSLIDVRSGSEGRVQFHRVAVGDHLLLGGDNLDLALAHHVERKLTERNLLPQGRLEPHQWNLLIPSCRHAKETLLSANAPHVFTLVLPGTGSRLIGGSLQIELSRGELLELFIDGFLPSVSLEEKPARRQSGFQEFGLPYAADPAMTKYLASFLNAHRSASNSGGLDAVVGVVSSGTADRNADLLNARPDIVLFNGGFFESPVLRDRLIFCIEEWFRGLDPTWSPTVLRNDRLDLAVAQGAAYFGMVRRGLGVRIAAGLARTYYIGVERSDGTPAALCLVGAGTEPSAETFPIEHAFEVRTSEPVEFPIYVSGTRLTDPPGSLVDFDPDQMSALPPIRTVLTNRKKGEGGSVAARISARLTEIGTLEMWCEQRDGSRRWQLQFDVRSATETDRAAHSGIAETSGIVDQGLLQIASLKIASVFGSHGSASIDGLAKGIAADVGISRTEWPPSLLRSIWADLMENESGRRRSPAYEARWLNLLGFCLRPGFGMAADDWRVEESWKTLKGKLVHGGAACLAEWRILCRRIAGGLTASRQSQLALAVLPLIRQKHRQVVSGRGKSVEYAVSNHEASEIWRMLGSLELIDESLRAELGNIALDFVSRPFGQPIRSALIWSLGRLGSRVPMYGPLNLVLPVSTVRPWIRWLLDCDPLQDPAVDLALMQLGRRTQDRFRDIDEGLRQQIVSRLLSSGARPHLIQLVREGGTLEHEEAGLIFGESLPSGLRVVPT